MRTRVKICGITRAQDAAAAVAAGADAIGLVFWPGSRRVVSVATARDIVDSLPPFVTSVALFVDPEASAVRAVLAGVQPGLLQFHGGETAAFCAQFGLPYIKAVRMDAGGPALDAAQHPAARALLLDHYDPVSVGGTGRSFDWTRIPADCPRPLVLAGGLHAGNVGAAIALARPYAVDVSSGVEQSPGIKDPGRIVEFMRAVRAADAEAGAAATAHTA